MDFIDWQKLVQQIITTIIFLSIGLVCFWFSDWFIERALPLSVRKALEEDKNTALAIVIGAALIGLSIIIAAAIR